MKVVIKVARNNEGDDEGSDEGGGEDCNLFERSFFYLWQADGLTDEWTDTGDCWVAFVTENLKPNLPV